MALLCGEMERYTEKRARVGEGEWNGGWKASSGDKGPREVGDRRAQEGRRQRAAGEEVEQSLCGKEALVEGVQGL